MLKYSIIILLLISCAHKPKYTAEQLKQASQREFSNQCDQVFPAVVSTFMDYGYNIQAQDPKTGLVTVTKVVEANAMAMALGNISTHNLTGNIFLRAQGDKCIVKISFTQMMTMRNGAVQPVSSVTEPKIFDGIFNQISGNISK